MKILRAFCGLYLIFCIVFTISVGINKIKETYPYKPTEESKQIINFWHVETFNSGFGSKKSFLLSAVRSFEITNDNALIRLTSYDLQTAKNNLERGEVPDIVSTGYGLNVIPTVSVENINNDNAGKIGDKNFANVWCRGQYFLISKKENMLASNKVEKLIVCEQENTVPILSILNELTVENFQEYNSTDAIKEFIKSDDAVMLGSESEVLKLENLDVNFYSLPLSSYNDRLQFVAVTSTDVKRQFYSIEFVKFLLSEKVQIDLSKIYMYSNVFDVVFESEKLNLGVNLNKYNTLSLFNLPESIDDIKSNARLALLGIEDAKNKLKKVIVSS